MVRAKLAERLLALVTTRERAAAAVGDLLELHGGRAWFWWAVVRTLCVLSWQFAPGILAAALAEWSVLNILKLRWPTPMHQDWRMYLPAGMTVLWTLLAGAAVFGSIRLGTGDAICRLAIALALLTTPVGLLTWMPLDRLLWWVAYAQPVCQALAVLVILAAFLTPRGRGALPRLLLAMVAGALPLLWALDCVLSYGQDPGLHPLSGFDYLVMTLAGVGCLLSASLVAVVLESHRNRRRQVS